MSGSIEAIGLASRSRLDTISEEALLARSRERDLEAFARIVDAYQARVLGFVRRMARDDEEALDLTQEVFVRAFQAIGRFDGRSSLRTWLFRIAANLCADRARRADRNPPPVPLPTGPEAEDEVALPDGRWDPESALLAQEFQALVDGAVAGLSETLRAVLLLHDYEDMSYEEIAATLSIPVGTVKSRLFLARARLQKAVKPYIVGEGAPR